MMQYNLYLAVVTAAVVTAAVAAAAAAIDTPNMPQRLELEKGGALIYIDFGPGDDLELMQLNLATNTTSKLVGLGNGGSFFDMVSTTSSDSATTTYYTTLQYKLNGQVHTFFLSNLLTLNHETLMK